MTKQKITVWLDASERSVIQAMAEKDNRSVSSYVVLVLREKIRDEKAGGSV